MLETLQTVLIALATFAIVVTVHEYGHFLVARLNGVKVLRFSIGFGRSLVTWRGRAGTEYVIAALPLGGYVRMADEREGDVDEADLPLAFNRQPVWSRMAIAAAGPLANFLLAVVVLWALFLRGEAGLVPLIGAVEPESLADMAGLESGHEIVSIDGRVTPTVSAVNFALLERLGDSGQLSVAIKRPGSDVSRESSVAIFQWLKDQEEPNLLEAFGVSIQLPLVIPRVGGLSEDGAAIEAGFQVNDLIISADGQDMNLWMDWVQHVRARPDMPTSVTVERAGVRQNLVVTPAPIDAAGEIVGAVGMSVSLPEIPEAQQRRFERGPLEALWAALERTGDLVGFTFTSISRMLQGLISPANLSGPLTIAQVAASTAEAGWVAWFGFVALLSVSLGALNLLPIPVLDGGHLVFYVIEALIGRPLPERVQLVGYQMGLVMVLSIMVFALYNDISKF
ncbi:MAG: RIP metalloprotease RseP [Luminiphilus sp.]|nr:RIP metalloprotease RseP [Luminiphilus sp.]MBL6897681.1 RIP metalloprotease RseP [Luminiphilus sp.]